MSFELSKEQCAEFLSQAGVSEEENYEVRQIGTDAEMVNLILDRIRIGEKTMTFSLPWIVQRTGGTEPTVGHYSIIVDADGSPCMLFRITDVKSLLFGEVSEKELAREGVPMRTVEAWKPLHVYVWNLKLEPFDLTVSDDMPVWAEYFDVVYSN